jgi:hypothetical protein
MALKYMLNNDIINTNFESFNPAQNSFNFDPGLINTDQAVLLFSSLYRFQIKQTDSVRLGS